jgi:hypothetical protein
MSYYTVLGYRLQVRGFAPFWYEKFFTEKHKGI